MNETPGHPFPIITDKTRLGFRFPMFVWWVIVSALITGISVLVGFCIWLNTMHDDVQALKSASIRQAEMLESIRDSVREIEFRQKFGITAGLPLTRGTP